LFGFLTHRSGAMSGGNRARLLLQGRQPIEAGAKTAGSLEIRALPITSRGDVTR